MCTGKSGHIVWLKYFAHFWKSSLKSLIPIEPMSITLWGLLESALFISERNLPVLMELYFWTFQDWDLLILENIKKNILFIPKFPDTMLKLHACHAWLKLKLSCFRKHKNVNLKITFLTNTNSYVALVYREIQAGPWTTRSNEKMISVPKTWHLFWPRDSSLRQQQHPQWQKKHTTSPQRQHLTNGICAIPKTSYI